MLLLLELFHLQLDQLQHVQLHLSNVSHSHCQYTRLLLLLLRSHVLTHNRAVDHQVTTQLWNVTPNEPEPDYEMLQQEKQSQILDCYNK